MKIFFDPKFVLIWAQSLKKALPTLFYFFRVREAYQQHVKFHIFTLWIKVWLNWNYQHLNLSWMGWKLFYRFGSVYFLWITFYICYTREKPHSQLSLVFKHCFIASNYAFSQAFIFWITWKASKIVADGVKCIIYSCRKKYSAHLYTTQTIVSKLYRGAINIYVNN